MEEVKKFIAQRKQENEQHAFIRYLQNTKIPAEQRLSYLPYTVYFVMSFADINGLLLPDKRNNEPIQKMINQHGAEDSKHWAWFLQDLKTLELDYHLTFTEAIKFIWSNHTQRTRACCYKLIQLCLNAQSLEKLVIIEALEAMGKVWLDNCVAVAKEIDYQDKLIYLGQHHSEREVGHAMNTSEAEIEKVTLSPAMRAKAKNIVIDLFNSVEAFYDELLENIETQEYKQYGTLS